MVERNPNRGSTVYLGTDGYWHGRVTVGLQDDGAPDRRHVMSKSKGVVVGKVRDLERDREKGQVRRTGQRWTVGAWLEHWLEQIARPALRPNSYEAYRNAVQTHLIPALGKHRLDRLEPEHLERLYQRMIADGARPGNAHQVHRTARTAIGEAHRRDYVSRNIASLAKPPRIEVEEVEPYTVEEVRAILAAAELVPNRARWAIALALGLRQGEVLGLRWPDVDLDRGCSGCVGHASGRSISTAAAARAAGCPAGAVNAWRSTMSRAIQSRGRAGV